MAQMGFLINSAQCSGCKACELACKDIHNFEIAPGRVGCARYAVAAGPWTKRLASAIRAGCSPTR